MSQRVVVTEHDVESIKLLLFELQQLCLFMEGRERGEELNMLSRAVTRFLTTRIDDDRVMEPARSRQRASS